MVLRRVARIIFNMVSRVKGFLSRFRRGARVHDLESALDEIERALRLIEANRVEEGLKHLEEGLRLLEKGKQQLISLLEEKCREVSVEANVMFNTLYRMLEELTRDLEKGVRGVRIGERILSPHR